MIKNESKKNGLVELFRFLCSLWVAYFHGFSPILSDKFNGENASTDFFFMVSGFFFLKSIEKYIERPVGEGVRFIFWGRTKRFIVPLCLAAMSILLCNIIFEMDMGFNWPLSFLWFFAGQFAYLSLFYLILKKLKRTTAFNIAIIVIACICLSLVIFDLKQFYRVVRGPAMVAIGMLASQLPRININLKNRVIGEKITLFIYALGFSLSAISFIYLAYLPGQATWKLHLMCCVVCPALLYFATGLPVRSKFLNLLGEFSVFVYLAQCPILFHHYTVSRDTRDQFPLLCICAVAMFIINRIINKISNKKQLLKCA